jgi:hypothetical protein
VQTSGDVVRSAVSLRAFAAHGPRLCREGAGRAVGLFFDRLCGRWLPRPAHGTSNVTFSTKSGRPTVDPLTDLRQAAVEVGG